MNSFTPIAAVAGGLLIGTAAALLWVFDGRIAGVSGVIAGLLSRVAGEQAWRVAFLVGLVVAPILYTVVVGAPAVAMNTGTTTLIAAGLLVGFGTRMSGGCTSGHGVCGIARLSPRSITATLLFMAAAAATVFIKRHLLGS